MFVASMALAVLLQAAAPAKVELAGVVVDARGRPAAGVEVLLSSAHQAGGRYATLARATTDQRGRFRHEATSTDPEGEIWTLWAHRAGASMGVGAVATAEGWDLPRPGPPITLSLGPPRSSIVRVLDPTGRPVEGALIRPTGVVLPVAGTKDVENGLPIASEIADRLAVRTDAQGCGELKGLPPDALDDRFRVEAPGYGAQGIMATASKDGLRIARLARVGRLVGRIAGPDATRARGAKIEVQTTLNVMRCLGFDPEGHATVAIDAAGRFEVPALAVGRLFLRLRPPDGAPEQDLDAPDVVIEAGKTCTITIPLPGGEDRGRAVAGRVVDRRGRPVAGAVVFQSGDGPGRTRTTTDEHGRFRLEGFGEGPAFLFARKDGFRFHGQPVGSETITMTRVDEKPEPIRTRPSPLEHRKELALARRVIKDDVDRVLEGKDIDGKAWMLEVMARVDPDRALAAAEKATFPDPFYNEMIRMRVIEGMAHDDPDAAADIAGAMQVAMARAQAYLAVANAIDPTPAHRARRLAMIDQALLDGRGVKEGDRRLICLGQVAEALLDLGEVERATKLLREGETLARELPTAGFQGFVRGAIAEELAPIDLAAALTLTKDLKDPFEFDRHHGNIAHELAARDPAAAERVLAMVRDQRRRDSAAIRVCYRMATADRDRARKIAGAIRHTLMKPYALGMMAQALSGPEKTRPAAAGLLAEAFDELEKSVEAGTDELNNMESAAAMAASMLPVAEAIDPTLVAEYLWRSVSCRRPRPGPGTDPSRAWFVDTTTIGLAMRVARYDHAIARGLLDPIVRRVESEPDRGGAFVAAEAIVALALVDPQRAVALFEKLPDGPPRSSEHQTRDRARRELAGVLVRTAGPRWNYLQWEFFHAWVPDVEDIAGRF